MDQAKGGRGRPWSELGHPLPPTRMLGSVAANCEQVRAPAALQARRSSPTCIDNHSGDARSPSKPTTRHPPAPRPSCARALHAPAPIQTQSRQPLLEHTAMQHGGELQGGHRHAGMKARGHVAARAVAAGRRRRRFPWLAISGAKTDL